MKNSVIKLIAAIGCVVITLPALAGGKTYGKKFNAQQAEPVSVLAEKMGDKSSLDNVVVKGRISQVCQAEGCWVKLKNDKGEDVFIRFKDHAFVVPKNIAGKTAVVNGQAIRKTISVAERRHMAEDAGASAEEIARITEPKDELRVEATGIVVE